MPTLPFSLPRLPFKQGALQQYEIHLSASQVYQPGGFSSAYAKHREKVRACCTE